jgi:hypothetical protein
MKGDIVFVLPDGLGMSIFHERERASYGLRGPVRTLCCETIESSGLCRTESAWFDEAGDLEQEIHQLGSDSTPVKRTFAYQEHLLLEERTYLGQRLLSTATHVYNTGRLATSRFLKADGSLSGEDRYEWQMIDGGGVVVSLHYGGGGPFRRSFKMSSSKTSASSYYLSLDGVTKERRSISSSGEVLARFLLDGNGDVRALGVAKYNSDERIISERFFVGPAAFVNVFTIPLEMNEVATLSYDYASSGRSRLETLTGYNVGSVKTIGFDLLGNPLLESVMTDSNTHITEYSYEYDQHENWIKRVVRVPSQTSLTDEVTTARRIQYY